MPAVRMHADQIDTSAALVRRLLRAQFPRWAGLAVAGRRPHRQARAAPPSSSAEIPPAARKWVGRAASGLIPCPRS